MNLARTAAIVVALLLVVGYAAGSGFLVSTSGEWYQSLDQPSWQPPPAVFGLAWTYNFVVLAVVGVSLAVLAPPTRLAVYLGLFAASVVMALAWAYLFYGPHALAGAAVALTACAALTVGMVVVAFSERWWLGALLLPYQAWLVIAASLSWGYVRLN